MCNGKKAMPAGDCGRFFLRVCDVTWCCRADSSPVYSGVHGMQGRKAIFNTDKSTHPDAEASLQAEAGFAEARYVPFLHESIQQQVKKFILKIQELPPCALKGAGGQSARILALSCWRLQD